MNATFFGIFFFLQKAKNLYVYIVPLTSHALFVLGYYIETQMDGQNVKKKKISMR